MQKGDVQKLNYGIFKEKNLWVTDSILHNNINAYGNMAIKRSFL